MMFSVDQGATSSQCGVRAFLNITNLTSSVASLYIYIYIYIYVFIGSFCLNTNVMHLKHIYV